MKKYSKETVVGIFVVIGLICIAYMAVNLGNVGFLGENTYSLYGKFNTVTGLRVGNPVNMLGLEIGRVEKFTMDQENQVVQVEFKINKGIEIYDDAIASVKTEGLIGDKFVSSRCRRRRRSAGRRRHDHRYQFADEYHGSGQQVCVWRCGRRGRKGRIELNLEGGMGNGKGKD